MKIILCLILLLYPLISFSQGPEHYKVITQNNLFRPLGWVKPIEISKIKLIGTWVGVNGEPKIAYVKNIRNNKISRLGIGSNYNGDMVLHISRN